MEFKIKQHSAHLIAATFVVLFFTLTVIFVIPGEEVKFFASAVGVCAWLVLFISAWIISSFPTKLTVDSDVLEIRYPLGVRKINMSDITGLSVERYYITHYAKYKGYSKEHRMRLTIYANGKTIKLNDAASRKRDSFTRTTVYEELPDSEISLYNAYEMLRYHTGIK